MYGMDEYFRYAGYGSGSITTDTSFYTQLIYSTSAPRGMTFSQYKAEIDAGRVVMIHVQGHSMFGYGYIDSGGQQKIIFDDTWGGHGQTMDWGGSYSGMSHWGVTAFTPSGGKCANNNKFWAAAAGTFSWNINSRWDSAGVPVDDNDVYLWAADGQTYTIQYNKPDPPAALSSFHINATTSSSQVTFEQGRLAPTTATFTANKEYIGSDQERGTARYTHLNGTNNCTELYVMGSGIYNLYGGTLNAQDVIVQNTTGFASRGLFQLFGGTLNAGNIHLYKGGTFYQNGGTLHGIFYQKGGTINGTLVNNDVFINYYSGNFNGQLVNRGTVYFFQADGNANFTAGNGMINDGQVYNINNFGNVPPLTLTFNGAGLTNNGYFSLAYKTVLQGSGPIINNGYLSMSSGDILGDNTFTNYGMMNISGMVGLKRTGTQTNYGEINLYSGSSILGLTYLTNKGNINISSGCSITQGTLLNDYTGTLNGGGNITSQLDNYGTINVNSVMTIYNAFNNRATGVIINAGGKLQGGKIRNYGTLEGKSGAVVANDIDNLGVIGVGGGNALTLTGILANTSAGKIWVRNNSRLIISRGLASNNGTIISEDSMFSNNGFALRNYGKMIISGNLETGGLTNFNNAKLFFRDGGSTVTGTVANNIGGVIQVIDDPVYFVDNVTNNGTFKVTNTQVYFLGTFTGSYSSDPAQNYFTDLVTRPQDSLLGGRGDKFFISNDFVNHSKQDLAWNTLQAELAFTNGGDNLHKMYVPGADKGAVRSGFLNNFAWGTLDVNGQILALLDGNMSPGGGFYVGEIFGAIVNGTSIANIFGNNLNIYYDPFLAGNAYLDGLCYALQGGGYLAPVSASVVTPLPGSLYLILTGLIGLGVMGRRNLTRRS